MGFYLRARTKAPNLQSYKKTCIDFLLTLSGSFSIHSSPVLYSHRPRKPLPEALMSPTARAQELLIYWSEDLFPVVGPVIPAAVNVLRRQVLDQSRKGNGKMRQYTIFVKQSPANVYKIIHIFLFWRNVFKKCLKPLYLNQTEPANLTRSLLTIPRTCFWRRTWGVLPVRVFRRNWKVFQNRKASAPAGVGGVLNRW